MVKSSKFIEVGNIGNEEKSISCGLFRLRLSSGLSRYELSKMTGIDEISLASYENAIKAIPASDLYIISIALGFNVDDLYGVDYLCDSNAQNFLGLAN